MKRFWIAMLFITAAACGVYFFSRQRAAGIRSKAHLRVAIIGNTFAERMQHYNYFETMLTASYTTDSIVVRNFGWSGDELTGSLRPLNFPSTKALLKTFQPDVIIACYGMNES